MASSSVVSGENILLPADAEARGLPAGYGETTAALLPRDPDWMFAY